MGTLACSLISGLVDQGEGVIATAQSVATLAQDLATDIGAGEGLLSTAQAIATDFDAGELGATAAALATQINSGDLLSTAQALVTDVDLDEFLVTAQAVGTLAAEGGGDPIATAQAVATQFAATNGEIPENIPLPEGDLANLFTSSNLVSFTAVGDFDDLLMFYQEEMIANGWSPVDDGSVISPNAAVLNFQIIGQKATVTISGLQGENQNIVLIILQPN